MASFACARRPVNKIIPYVIKPEEVTPGVANWYASSDPTTGYGVRDNGVGMTKDEIAFAMQPFHQLDTRKQTGTGLGLPVTKALVDANRARLVLTSEPQIGTSADVIFPAERLFTSG